MWKSMHHSNAVKHTGHCPVDSLCSETTNVSSNIDFLTKIYLLYNLYCCMLTTTHITLYLYDL